MENLEVNHMKKKNIFPFIKWVGGKSKYIKEIEEYIPSLIDRYYEPFIGGGALFLHLQPKKAYISDINIELINCYQVIRADAGELMKELDILIDPNTSKNQNLNVENFYYHLRNSFNYLKKENAFSYDDVQEPSKKEICIQKASLFIYLNKTCFRGLYRENKSGEMNVPYGHYKTPAVYEKDNLLQISEYLLENDITISHHSFDKINPTSNDFVYMDPPYDKESSTDFTSYTKHGFDQEKLFIFVQKLICPFVLSNSPTQFVKNKYSKYGQKIMSGKRSVDIKKIKTVKEIEIIIYKTN